MKPNGEGEASDIYRGCRGNINGRIFGMNHLQCKLVVYHIAKSDLHDIVMYNIIQCKNIFSVYIILYIIIMQHYILSNYACVVQV